MPNVYTKILKYFQRCWWHHCALLGVITGETQGMNQTMNATPGPLHICHLMWRNGHQGTVNIKTSYKEMKTGVQESSLMDVAWCESVVQHDCNIVTRYWPLIGREWSRDLDTGHWLADTTCNIVTLYQGHHSGHQLGRGLPTSNMDISYRLQPGQGSGHRRSLNPPHLLSAMWPTLSLDPAVYYSVCFDDLVIDWVQQNIEALKSNGKQLVSSLMTDCVWLFVWEPGDTESAGTNILLNKLFRAENSKFSVRNCQVF